QLAERMLAAELTHHLETEAEQGKSGNHRNGASPKTVITPNGELSLEIPRDRQATFEPQLIGKYRSRAARLRRSRHQHVRTRHERSQGSGPFVGTVRAASVAR